MHDDAIRPKGTHLKERGRERQSQGEDGGQGGAARRWRVRAVAKRGEGT